MFTVAVPQLFLNVTLLLPCVVETTNNKFEVLQVVGLAFSPAMYAI